MNLELLRKHVADGVINTQRHPEMPLDIFNYSARCQYEKLWDDVTLACRGLVLHGDNIVARPFRKFFNDTELGDMVPWHLPSVITEKMDGSLGICFYFAGNWHWATRGSFTSEQSREANRIMEEQYDWVPLDPSITYLFEIIYPENRIVVDYRNTRDLVLLGMVVTKTGEELPLERAPGGLRVVRRLPAWAPSPLLRELIQDHEEGYVVRFEDGSRVKIKGERYVQLHKAISGLSSRSVWECLSAGGSVASLLAVVPDECAEWIRAEEQVLLAEFARMKLRAFEATVDALRLSTRKQQAEFILTNFRDVSGIAFSLLDGRDPDKAIWKLIYPERRTPALTARLER